MNIRFFYSSNVVWFLLRWFKSFLKRKTGVEHLVSIPTIKPCDVANAKISCEPVLKYFKSIGTPTAETSSCNA